jgi:Carboxypeptidase regulatory-like domain/TonB-dependent Receptor Plug Domain
MSRIGLALLGALAAASALAAQRPTVITGRVSEAESHQPVVRAQVRVLGDPLQAFTDDRGAFRLTGVPTGPHGLLVRAIGYRPVQIDVTLEAGDSVALDTAILAMTPVAVDLPGLLVESGSLQSPALALAGFYDRRSRGFGAFAERDEIQRWLPHTISDVLRRMPGVSITANPNYGRSGPPVDFRRYLIGMRGCGNIMFFLDGTSLGSTADPAFDLDLVADAMDVAAVEAYRGPSEIPLQFNVTNSLCGVVLLWTER